MHETRAVERVLDKRGKAPAISRLLGGFPERSVIITMFNRNNVKWLNVKHLYFARLTRKATCQTR